MSNRYPGGDEGLIRPYVAAPATGSAGTPASPDVEMLRPYLLTSGRVAPTNSTLEIEAQVVTSPQGRATCHSLAFELRDIVILCGTAMSVAEVAARLRYHIGVVRVLVADLAASGHVIVRRPGVESWQDVPMIERVIRALESIP